MTPERARELIHRFAGKRVAVVGDLMLDRYIIGSASRISPEAPVPVVRVHHETSTLGGAANVMRNLATLGARPLGFGVVGADKAGDDLLAALVRQGVDVAGVQRDTSRRTSVKTRLIADHQQVARIDDEDDAPLRPTIRRRLMAGLRQVATAGQLDAVILEDYHKGVISRALAVESRDLAKAHRLPIALDPHPGNTMRVPGLTLMTPNRAEAFALAGCFPRAAVMPPTEDKALLEVGRRLKRRWRPDHLLVTLGAGGMALFEAEGSETPHHVPTVAREVFDVSGAGDTVIATWILALVVGATPLEAAMLSNQAAGVVVGKVGTAPIEVAELLATFDE